MNQSIHMVDMLCDLMPPHRIGAGVHGHAGPRDRDGRHRRGGRCATQTGALGVIYGTTASFPGQFRRFEITGTKGTVINVENSITVWQFADERPEDAQIREKFMKIQGGGGVADPAAITHENHTRNFKAFLDALETGKDFWISGPEARKAVEVILAIYRSAQREAARQAGLTGSTKLLRVPGLAARVGPAGAWAGHWDCDGRRAGGTRSGSRQGPPPRGSPPSGGPA